MRGEASKSVSVDPSSKECNKERKEGTKEGKIYCLSWSIALNGKDKWEDAMWNGSEHSPQGVPRLSCHPCCSPSSSLWGWRGVA